jgi:2-dehydropantoate 2-reductase
MRIAIVGAGAVGSLFGGLLTRSGQEVWLYNCSFVEHIRAIRAEGLRVQSAAGEQKIPVAAVTHARQIPGKMDLVGIFVKAYDTEQAIRDALPLLGEESWVLSLQNGIGPEGILARYLPKKQILRGITAQGATLVEPGVIRWAGRGPTRFGLLETSGPSIPPSAQELVKIFERAGIESQYEPKVELQIWEKLLINAAINPLTALFDVRNGALVEDPMLRAIARDIVQECLPVVADHGVHLSCAEAMGRVEGVCQATAGNLSSMLQDVRRGKRTEIEYINGVIVSEGERLEIPTPLNRLLTQLVHKNLPGGMMRAFAGSSGQ